MTTALFYAPLHLRSNYSLQRGGSSIGQLLARARQYELPVVALTDVNGLYGAVPFAQGAREHDIRPIFGCHLDDGRTHGVLLARNRTGYETLCRLVSRRHLEPEGFTLFEALRECHDDVHVLVEDLGLAERLGRTLPAGRLWLELVRPGRSARHERELLRTARRCNLPLVATNDVHFCDEKDFPTHRLLTAIRTGTTLGRLGSADVAHPGNRLHQTDAVRHLFRDHRDALTNTCRIADDCDVTLLNARPIFPRFETKPGKTTREMLRDYCQAGLVWRYGPNPSEAARQRLRRELDLIGRLGFDEYFLVVREIVRYAREHDLPIAGRGSGASSLVAYVLGLTNVCPLRFNLEFARFLHEARVDPPDLDLDFCWRTRDDVINHVFEMFGKQNVAMVSSHLTFQPKSAFRETAKAMGLANDQVTALIRALPYHVHERLFDRGADLSRFDVPIPRERFGQIVAGARRILDFPSHLSVHPGGVVIGRKPIDRYLPLEPAAKGVVITQFDKDGVEAIGLVKFDLLGNRAISTIAESLDWVRRICHRRINIETLPADDPETIAMLQGGHTVGCNQLESPAMRNLLCQMKPASMTDVMRILALIRPGAANIGMKDAFIRRRRGDEPPDVGHPALGPILGENYGVMLYEDDAMLVAAALTGLPIAQADRFRKEIQKSAPDSKMIRLSGRFLEQCGRNNVPRDVAEKLWVQLAKFNSYSFCKAHAASYAVLAYAVAYLKCHYPLAFWAAALNNNEGMYAKRVLVEEAKRAGIRFFLPCVNRSGLEFTVDGNGIRVGLERIGGLSRPTLDGLFARRKNGPFASLADFLARVPTTLADVQALIRVGAFDFTDRPRPQLLLELRSTFADLQRWTGGCRLFDQPVRSADWPSVGDYSEGRKWQMEVEGLGLSVGPHLLTRIRPLVPRRAGEIDSRALGRHVGKKVTLLGVIDALRRVRTAAGEHMEFVTFEDEHGIFEVTMFPNVYARYNRLLGHYGPYRITGVVECQYDAITVTAHGLERLNLKRPRPGKPKLGKLDLATLNLAKESRDKGNLARRGRHEVRDRLQRV